MTENAAWVANLQQETNEPGVINRETLLRLAVEQGAKGEAQKLFLQDGVRLEEIEEIRIEFLNILRIDNLWIMADRLTRLKLSNNLIERIENLESLVNLRELDLSFNRIEKMENLEKLVNLEVLLLYNNEIEEVEGIDSSTGLTILSVGANRIPSWDHVIYLRKFDKLRVLNMTGNACTDKEGYSNYLVAFLPQLEYLNYKMISQEERRAAFEKYQRKIANLEEKESTEKAEKEEERERKERLALLSVAFVEYLDRDELFEMMFKQDTDGRGLSEINQETQRAYEEFKKNFIAICYQLYEVGLKEHERRKNEIELFSKIVEEGRVTILKEARETMEKIIERKTEIFFQIARLVESIDVFKDEDQPEPEIVEEKQMEAAQKLSDEFNNLLSTSWSNLMYREIVLHEQIEDTNETFKSNMLDMKNFFAEAARASFAQMRYLESEYKDLLDSIISLYINTFSDDNRMPAHHFQICGDRDILANSLAASHDLHLQAIDAREDDVLSRLNNWYEGLVERIFKEETQRNRRQILEISHFLEKHREEFENLQLQLQLRSPVNGNGPVSLEADVAAALE